MDDESNNKPQNSAGPITRCERDACQVIANNMSLLPLRDMMVMKS